MRYLLSVLIAFSSIVELWGQSASHGLLISQKISAGATAPTINNTWTYSGAGTTLTVAPTAGHFFWVGICESTTVTAPTDNIGSTYTADGNVANLGYNCKSYHLASAGSGITTVTVATVTGWVFALDASGGGLAGTADKTSTTFTTGGGAFNSDSQTPTAASEVVIGFGYSNDGSITTTCGAGWTTLYGSGTTHVLCTQTTSTIASKQFSGTTTSGNLWNGQMQTYK